MKTLIWLGSLTSLISGCQHRHSECGKLTPHVNLRVVDKETQNPLDGPSFAENGNFISAGCSSFTYSCIEPEPLPDAAAPCAGWLLELIGKHDVTVRATGYSAATVTVDTGLVETVCGVEPASCVAQTVALSHH